MLKLIGWVIKLTLFAAVVLVLGNWLRWDGKSISDQVKTTMSHAEKAPIVTSVSGTISGWTGNGRKPSAARQGKQPTSAGPESVAGRELREESAQARPAETAEAQNAPELLSTERQKLRALLRELNGPRASN